jgi:4'-phosphopantetheinyl transferase
MAHDEIWNMAGMALTIDLWLWPLDVDPAQVGALAKHLSADEAARADRFHHARDRDRYIVGRGHLRVVLGDLTGCRPQDIRLTYGAEGKPELKGGPFFNLSHSGGWAALAITPAAPVGIDIEAHRPVDNGLAASCFSKAEMAVFRTLPPSDRRSGFFRCWTRKEAFLKAQGSGLSCPLDSFDVTLEADTPPRITRISAPADDPAAWQLVDLALGPGMAGAVAVRAMGPVDLVLRGGTLPLPVQTTA